MATAAIAQDRLIRKEVLLGAIRDVPPPLNHIGHELCARSCRSRPTV